ncbi:uncharacterized protein EI97DRAFT_45911 [Westerdykella ornata]|uniref:Glycoside hydrolase n=1 Tax=Westerdykella ornata TaxID=318751 RepID=A0A6A6JLT4_WESOR|nr:uncharacterized protein EI97DRAFT_45911 [Westerdykella ornata]KAF2276616.1 hypothetical protein EI97DRAFT_45911 [Westerdykella ornata]
MHPLVSWFFCTSALIMIPAILLQVHYRFEQFRGVIGDPPPPPVPIDLWCGKAYHPTDPSFDPGGELAPPEREDGLQLVVYPRYSFYLSSEKKGSLIVDTPIQRVSGEHFRSRTSANSTRGPSTYISIRISNAQTSETLVNWETLPVNSWGNEVEFDLGSTPVDRGISWLVSVIGRSPDAALQTSYSGAATVTVLPERNDGGSVARVDYLFGGIEVRSSLTKGEWKTIYPYSFYTSWDWISSTINSATATKNLATFRANGYNLIHPVPPGGTDPFNHTVFEEFLRICDELELYVMYDMRHTYKNNTSISAQLSRLQHHPSLLLYYTADEPDGWTDPLNATQIAYQHINSIDPYHPVSLVLNCANFYFKDYSSGADIILEDTYPIAVNTSFSTVYNTPCNTTYGDCGCDNCHAYDPAYPAYIRNPFLDIIERTENLQTYQEWLGASAKKPIWGVPQAFYDRGSFWQRWPSKEEEAVMAILRLNHGAKGIVAWLYPTSDEIEEVTSSLAKVVTAPEVTKYTLGTRRVTALDVVGDDELVDVTAWIREEGMLLSYVYVGYTEYTKEVEISLPEAVTAIESLWGEGGKDWTLGGDGKTMRKRGLTGLEVGILQLSRRDSTSGLYPIQHA